MSTTSSSPPATRHADRALFARLIDDAAVFPPGLAPLERAVSDHLERRDGPYADLIGPLLVPASEAGNLREVVDDPRHEVSLDEAPLQVGLIARTGTPVEEVGTALGILRGTNRVRVTGVEVAHQPGWEAALRWDLPLAVEVGRQAHERKASLAALAEATDEAVELRVKLRTQSTGADPVPTAEELAGFLLGCARHDLPVKLTGGLHRAVAHTARAQDGGTEERHGILNVLLAAHQAAQGAEAGDVVDALRVREAQTLAEILAAFTPEQAGSIRGLFTAYGCCGVMDPIEDLLRLGLLAGPEELTDRAPT
ncbi:hypothetical protein BH24ACT8_BH24ACT8_23860 [soil metagenome]